VCDPTVSDNLGLVRTPSLEATNEWIIQAENNPLARAYAIIHVDRHVGNFILDQMNSRARNSRLSIYIGSDSDRGGGIGRTALYHGLCEAFDKWELHKVWLLVHEKNELGVRAYQRMGFEIEGVHRDEFAIDGEWLNGLYMGILEPEFRKVQKNCTFEAEN
jgi:RimJ/RimL family protein N-acetyltransferase